MDSKPHHPRGETTQMQFANFGHGRRAPDSVQVAFVMISKRLVFFRRARALCDVVGDQFGDVCLVLHRALGDPGNDHAIRIG